MKTQDFNLGEWLSKKIIELIVRISKYQNIDFDNKLAAEYLKQTAKDRFKAIITQVKAEQEESKESLIFSSKAWQSKIFEVNLTHALLTYAKEVINYSKIDKFAEVK